MPSNDVIVKIVPRYLYLLFTGQCFEKRLSHSGKQPFRCDMCDYGFESKPSQDGERPFLSNVQMITKLFLQICLHLYGMRSRVALVIITCIYCTLVSFVMFWHTRMNRKRRAMSIIRPTARWYDSPLVRHPIEPTAHWSDSLLVEQLAGPTAHWSDSSFVRVYWPDISLI